MSASAGGAGVPDVGDSPIPRRVPLVPQQTSRTALGSCRVDGLRHAAEACRPQRAPTSPGCWLPESRCFRQLARSARFPSARQRQARRRGCRPRRTGTSPGWFWQFAPCSPPECLRHRRHLDIDGGIGAQRDVSWRPVLRAVAAAAVDDAGAERLPRAAAGHCDRTGSPRSSRRTDRSRCRCRSRRRSGRRSVSDAVASQREPSPIATVTR